MSNLPESLSKTNNKTWIKSEMYPSHHLSFLMILWIDWIAILFHRCWLDHSCGDIKLGTYLEGTFPSIRSLLLHGESSSRGFPLIICCSRIVQDFTQCTVQFRGVSQNTSPIASASPCIELVKIPLVKISDIVKPWINIRRNHTNAKIPGGLVQSIIPEMAGIV